MKGWKLQRPSGPNGYWEILDEDGNSIATLYGGADDKEIERKATLMVNAERMKNCIDKLHSISFRIKWSREEEQEWLKAENLLQ